MSVRFFEYKPSFQLNTLVQSYWTGDFNMHEERDFAQSVVPNGFIELIIHLTDAHCSLVKSHTWNNSPDHTLIGLHTQPYTVRFSNWVKVFGIRFYPEGITNIFGIPPAHFIATYEDGIDVFDNGFKAYCWRLRETPTLELKIKLTERFLLERLEKNRKEFDYVRMAAGIIRQQNGILNQEALMNQIPISTRQLQREFKNQYGITAKEYMRLARMNAIQKYMQSTQSPDFSDITYEHGFSDQPHFNREFKSITGNTPRAFVKDREKFIVNPNPPNP